MLPPSCPDQHTESPQRALYRELAILGLFTILSVVGLWSVLVTEFEQHDDATANGVAADGAGSPRTSSDNNPG